ncbi:hypothetical protein F4778DRAFT_783756 [Xylariomycetidae sp. FL2044]|nr:hypothetical protein F4778DRAFT_783756 [Xylariomycetidae sp. FL2044]
MTSNRRSDRGRDSQPSGSHRRSRTHHHHHHHHHGRHINNRDEYPTQEHDEANSHSSHVDPQDMNNATPYQGADSTTGAPGSFGIEHGGPSTYHNTAGLHSNDGYTTAPSSAYPCYPTGNSASSFAAGATPYAGVASHSLAQYHLSSSGQSLPSTTPSITYPSSDNRGAYAAPAGTSSSTLALPAYGGPGGSWSRSGAGDYGSNGSMRPYPPQLPSIVGSNYADPANDHRNGAYPLQLPSVFGNNYAGTASGHLAEPEPYSLQLPSIVGNDYAHAANGFHHRAEPSSLRLPSIFGNTYADPAADGDRTEPLPVNNGTHQQQQMSAVNGDYVRRRRLSSTKARQGSVCGSCSPLDRRTDNGSRGSGNDSAISDENVLSAPARDYLTNRDDPWSSSHTRRDRFEESEEE